MNSAEIKEISLAYNELFKNTKTFANFKESLENDLGNDDFNKEQTQQVLTEYQKRLDDIERFERALDKFEKFIPAGVFKNLKELLSNEKMALGNVCVAASGFLELNSQDALDSLIERFGAEQDLNATFAKEMGNFAFDLSFNLSLQAMNGNLDLQDLKLLASELEVDSDLYKRVSQVVDAVEKKQAEHTPEEKQETETLETEQPQIEQPKPVVTQPAPERVEVSAQPQPVEQQTQEPQKLTLEQKLAAINYQQGMNLNAVVQEVTLESKLDGISAEITQLQSKEKLTVRDKFKLRQLEEQKLALEAYGESLEEQKVSGAERKRNRQLDSTTSKIEGKENDLNRSTKKAQGYESKTMRFLSARYQNKLNAQLTVLREKQGMLTDMQKASAVARFDKNSKKIMKQARRKGTIEQLKAYKNELIQELQNLGNDVVRFFSTKEEDMPQLAESPIIMPDNIISLEERRRALTTGGMVA